MKKLLIPILIIICMLFVLGCSKKNQAYFDATVIEYSVDMYTVKVTDKGTTGISIGERAFVYEGDLSKNNPVISVGDTVRVFFDGVVMETAPLQLGEVYKVEVLK